MKRRLNEDVDLSRKEKTEPDDYIELAEPSLNCRGAAICQVGRKTQRRQTNTHRISKVVDNGIDNGDDAATSVIASTMDRRIIYREFRLRSTATHGYRDEKYGASRRSGSCDGVVIRNTREVLASPLTTLKCPNPKLFWDPATLACNARR